MGECEGSFATHHYACKCREEYFKKVEAKLAIAIEALERIEDSGGPNQGPGYTMQQNARETLKKIK